MMILGDMKKGRDIKISIDDKLESDGVLMIRTGPATPWVNKEEAIKIIEHLQKVFDIQEPEIVGIHDGEKWCKEHGFKTENCDPDCDE